MNSTFELEEALKEEASLTPWTTTAMAAMKIVRKEKHAGRARST